MPQTYQKFMHNHSVVSGIERDNIFKQIDGQAFDVVILGGGITGAGLAFDASSRGLSALLIDNDDFASGTSNRSTKLIHGGLRYLKNMQFAFVSQLGHERKTLKNNFPNLVIPTKVILPIYKSGILKKIPTFLGLKIYDLLAAVESKYHSKWITNKELIDFYPFINQKGLIGAFLYYEYKSFDGRLTIDILKTAAKHGAIVINFCQISEVNKVNNKIVGIEITNRLNNDCIKVKTACIINATGPWSAEVSEKFDFKLPKKLCPTKGVHIVFNKQDIPVSHAFYFDAIDGRMIFVIPKQDHVYIGTTDTYYTGDLRHISTSQPDATYLVDSVNKLFPLLQLNVNQIVSCWAGVRPLIGNIGDNPGEISRKEELFIFSSGFITITGGKLTGYRIMARKTIDAVFSLIGKKLVGCSTHLIPGVGSQFEIGGKTLELVNTCDRLFDQAKQTGIDVQQFKTLFYRYGSNIELITEKAYELFTGINNAGEIWLNAELWYSVNYEMTVSLSGFLIHRTDMVLFESQRTQQIYESVAEILAELLHWQPNETAYQIEMFKKDWQQYQLYVK